VTPRLYDLRRERVASAPKVKIHGGAAVVRDPGDVDAVTLHQMACVFGLTQRQIRASGGDSDLALARRGLRIACHMAAFRRGIYVATAPLRWHVQHGNGLNPTSLGFELEGLYSGLEDDPETYPRREDLQTAAGTPCLLDGLTIETARAALRWLVETARAEGMPIRYLDAHRQSSPTRRADPGQAVYCAIVPWAVRELRLETRPERVWQAKRGPGRPIPAAWGGVGAY
jgi:hypothetical protein